MRFKKIVYFLYLIFFSCCNNKNPYANNLGVEPTLVAQIDTAHPAHIKCIDSVIDFGVISVGDSVLIKRHFKNTSGMPLFILEARPACGCTITSFPKDPTIPGESSFITVRLKSGYHTGEINKAITIDTNTQEHTNSILILG